MKTGRNHQTRIGGIGVCLGAMLLIFWGMSFANIPLSSGKSSITSKPSSINKQSKNAGSPVQTGESRSGQTSHEELGPLEDLPASATLWLKEPANPEKIEEVDLGDGLKLTGRIRLGDAEVYIIELASPMVSDLPIMSVGEARQKGVLEIRELNGDERETFSKQYPSGGGGMVVVSNKSDVYVMIVGGEVLEGGNQDRMLASSGIIPPKSGWIPMPVNCVEQGRSRGMSQDFSVAEALAHPVLRANALCLANQKEVWEEVQRVNRREGTSNPTHTYIRALSKGRNRQAIVTAAGGIISILNKHPNAVGLAFAWRGRVVSTERFGSPALFHAQASSLLYSHLLGLADMRMQKASGPVSGSSISTSPGNVAGFFENLQSADRVRAPLNHQGVGVVIRGQGVLGGEILTNMAPTDASLRAFAADLGKKGSAPNVLHQWIVRMN